MDVAALIKQARHDARVTQQELARRVGRSRASISQLEAGVRTPSLGSLEAILAALGKQLRLELEPLDADVRREIVEHRHDPKLAGRVYFAVEQIEDLAVQPLHEIETTDKHAARVLRLLREQAQDA